MTTVDGSPTHPGDLSPIACESCRTRKRKCDRVLPSCTHCKHSDSNCQYPESSKRGIPTGYISSLERRLAETEIALYAAIRNICIANDDASLATLIEHSASQTRATKQAAWRERPIVGADGLVQWADDMDRILAPVVHPSHADVQRLGPVTTMTDRTPFLESSIPTFSTPLPSSLADEGDREGENVAMQAEPPDQADVNPRAAKRARPDRNIDEVTRSELGVMRRSRATNAASFVGSASGIQFVRAVYNALANASQENTADAPVIDGVPAEDDQVPESDVRSLWQDHEMSFDPSSTSRASKFYHTSDLWSWSRSYFDQWQPAYPFNEVSEVRSWLKMLAAKLPLSEDHRVAGHRKNIIRSIMSISLADRRHSISKEFSKPFPTELVFDSFGTALASVQSALIEPPSLESLQAVLSVQLFLVSMLRHNAASRLGGLVVRIIFQMGLHRCPARYTTFSEAEIHLRQRIFYAAYCLDRHICQSLGLPLTLRDDDIDVCRPGHEEHLTSAPSGDSTMSDHRLPDFLARHADIVGSIMELRNKSINHRHADHDQATFLSVRIAKWSNDVDGYLEGDGRSAASQFHHMVLTVLKGESIIALNRPLLSTKVKPEYDVALHACIGASRSIIITLHKHLPGSASAVITNETGVQLTWPSFTWSVWMSAFIILYAALEKEMERSVAARLADQATEILKHLATRGTIWPSACAAAVRDLSNRLSPSVRSSGLLSSESRQDATAVNEGRADFMTFPADGQPQSVIDDALSMPWASQYAFDDHNGDLFDGYDIPFWMGDDQYAPWLSDLE